MQTLENQARRRGLRMLDLSASLVSKRFYDSRGYVTREEGSFPVGDGQELKYFAMAKVLGESGPTVP
jgi:hypothetical protein